MIVLSFKSKKEKSHLLEKAKKLEEYAADIVDCLEEAHAEADEDYEYGERNYRHEEGHDGSRYGYRRRMR